MAIKDFARLFCSTLLSLYYVGGSSIVSRADSGGPRIIGSRLHTPVEVLEFRKRWECLASPNYSTWQLDPTPRVVPWATQKDLFGRFQNMNGLEVSKVNEAVRKGEYKDEPSKWPVPDSVKYKWALRTGQEGTCGPKPPDLGEIDMPGFCSALRRTKGSLFIVGDSLSTMFMGSIISELSARGEPLRVLDPTPACAWFRKHLESTGEAYMGKNSFHPCSRWMICGHNESDGGVVMHYIVSCHLQWVLRSVPKEPYGGSRWCKNMGAWFWGEEMVRENASVVLLNRGLHFVKKELFAPQLNYTLHELRKLLPEALLVYRSTAPGHPNCSKYEKPVDKPVDMSHAPYNWGIIPEEDRLAQEMVEGEGVQGAFLDVLQMTLLRADWHLRPEHNSDCLHYKIPGPTSTWPRFFAAMVAELV